MQDGNGEETREWRKCISKNYRPGEREQRAQRGVCDARSVFHHTCFVSVELRVRQMRTDSLSAHKDRSGS